MISRKDYRLLRKIGISIFLIVSILSCMVSISVLHLGYASRDPPADMTRDMVFLMLEDIQDKMVDRKASALPKNITCPKKSFNGIEDLLCMAPPRFHPGYKNPCWYSETREFRCLPYFQLIGAAKCASTDLYRRIMQHPDAFENSGSSNKEIHWWSMRRYGIREYKSKSFEVETFSDYLQYFQRAAEMIRKYPDRNYITGEASPMDLSDSTGWKYIPQNEGLSEPNYTIAHLTEHMNPGVKLLVILRDPVERLYSDYFFRRVGNMTAEGFHQAVIDAIELLHSCTRNSSLRACLYDRRLQVRLKNRIPTGFYSIFLQDWFKVFPRNQFLILRTEDFERNMITYLQEVYKFLGLRDLSLTNLTAICKLDKHRMNLRKQKVEMRPETRKIVQELYRNSNYQLAKLLNDDRFTWDY